MTTAPATERAVSADDRPALPPLPFLRPAGDAEPPGFPLRREVACAAAAAALALFHALVVLGLGGDTWFQDDPLIAWFVARVSPWEIVRSGDWGREIGAGNALTPLLPLSFWIDARLWGAEVGGYVAHHVASLAATAALLAALVHRLTASAPLALATTLAWLLLPSTAAVAEFLSTRHYLEGGAAFLLALRLTVARAATPAGRAARGAAALAALGVAMMAKEIYLVYALAGLAPFALHWRRFRVAYAAALAAGWLLFVRVFIIGPELTYHTLVPPSLDELPVILRHLPVMFAGGAAGAALVSCAPLAWLATRRRAPDAWGLLYFAGLVAAGWAVVYPVVGPLAAGFEFHGAWGRIMFHTHTALLLGVAWLGHTTASPPGAAGVAGGGATSAGWRRLALPLLCVAALAPGAATSRAEWDVLKGRYAAERRHYLLHPDRLLLTELRAPWYIFGVHLIDDVAPLRFLRPEDQTSLDPGWLARFPTVWRYRDGEYVADDLRHAELRAAALEHARRRDRLARLRPWWATASWGLRPVGPERRDADLPPATTR